MKLPLVVVVVSLLIALMAFMFALTSCGSDNNSAKDSAKLENANIVVPDGAPLIPFVGLANASTDSKTEDGVFKFSDEINKSLTVPTKMHIVSGSDQLVSAITQEKPEFAVMPVNLAAKLYNENKNNDDKSTYYNLLGITSWGLNQIVSNQKISSLNELVGKKLYSFGENEVPGIVLRAIIAQKGLVSVTSSDSNSISANAINIVNLSTAAEVSAALMKDGASGEAFGVLPEPVATNFLSKQSSFSATLNLQTIWSENNDDNYPMSGIAIRADLAANPDNYEYIQRLLPQLEVGDQLVILNSQMGIGVLKNKFNSTMFSGDDATLAKAIVDKRIDVHYSNLVNGMSDTFGLRDVDKNRTVVTKFLQTLLDRNPNISKMIGGSVPDDGFFLNVE